jgi:hypothetical protein
MRNLWYLLFRIAIFFSTTAITATARPLDANLFADYKQPAALGAYKGIIDAISSNPIDVLGKTWKKYQYEKMALAEGAYKDVINTIEDINEVLGRKRFEYSGMQRTLSLERHCAPLRLSKCLPTTYIRRNVYLL